MPRNRRIVVTGLVATALCGGGMLATVNSAQASPRLVVGRPGTNDTYPDFAPRWVVAALRAAAPALARAARR